MSFRSRVNALASLFVREMAPAAERSASYLIERVAHRPAASHRLHSVFGSLPRGALRVLVLFFFCFRGRQRFIRLSVNHVTSRQRRVLHRLHPFVLSFGLLRSAP